MIIKIIQRIIINNEWNKLMNQWVADIGVTRIIYYMNNIINNTTWARR